MREPSEAIAEILGRVRGPAHTDCVTLRQALGRVLAREVRSDVDLPPFEKSAMDGYAVRAADLPGAGPVELRVAGESRAGAPLAGEVPAGACAAIYTGAELPRGCDAVVMVEDSERAGDRVILRGGARPGQHVEHRGAVLATGDPAVRPGHRLGAADLAVLAAVGAEPVTVHRRPRLSILTTGDELVPATARPGPGQIREGNTLYLAAACERAGAEVLEVGIVPDDPEELARRFAAALETGDALVTTGGVSMGRYDLVGQAFERLGVEPVLHKVAIKPGKPVWFGVRGEKPVFGLPGNPVSSLLGFEVFVRPALARMEGCEAEARELLLPGVWEGPETAPNARQQNLPSRLQRSADGRTRLVPLPWKGSADIVGASRAEAFAVVPPNAVVREGDAIEYRPLHR